MDREAVIEKSRRNEGDRGRVGYFGQNRKGLLVTDYSSINGDGQPYYKFTFLGIKIFQA